MTDTLSYPFLRKTHKASSFPCRETVREGGTNKKKKPVLSLETRSGEEKHSFKPTELTK